MTPEEINAIEFVDNYKFEEASRNYTWCYSEEEVYKLVEEYGKQQWNEAIKLAAESVRLSLNGTNTPYGEHNCKQGDWTVNKGFILELLKP